MRNIKTPIMNGVIMALSFFVTLSLTYIAYGYVSGLGGKTNGNILNSSDWNSLVANIDEVRTPSGAVMSFNLTTCPSGWTEYTAARGRFIRGIDSTGTNDSVRVAGNTQADDFKSHAHPMGSNASVGIMYNHFGSVNGYGYVNGGRITWELASGYNTSSAGGIETRPKNVALLFCQKN